MTAQPATQTALTDCPYCGHSIGDNERQHIHRVEAERERHLRESLEGDYQQRLKEGIDAARDALEERLRQKYQQEVAAAQEGLDETNRHLEAAQEQLRKANERAEKAEEEFEVRMQGRLLEERKKAAEEADRRHTDEITKLQQQNTDVSSSLHQKENLIERLDKQIDDLKAKVESTEAIERGGIQEEQLVQDLRREFPFDRIEWTGTKGGADISHRVVENAETCGLIIYESKRVRNWQNTFTEKLAREKVRTGADYSVLVSTVFPANERNFCMKDGVPVVHPRHLIPFVTVLRDALVAIKVKSQSMEEGELKYQQLTNYLSGSEFKNRMQAILKNVDKLESLLNKEKRAHDRAWSSQALVHRRTTQMALEIQTEIGAILSGAVTKGDLYRAD